MDDTIGPVMLLQILSPEGVVLDEYEACGVHPSVVDLLATKQAGLHVVIGESIMSTTNTATPAAAPTVAPVAPVAPAAAQAPNLLASLGLDPNQLAAVMSALGQGMASSLAPAIGEAVGASLKSGLEGLKPVIRQEAKAALQEVMAEEKKAREEEIDWSFWGGCAAGGGALLLSGYAAWQAGKASTLLENLSNEDKPSLPAITM